MLVVVYLLHVSLFVWVGLLLVFVGCLGLKNSDEDDYSIGRFIVPYIAGFVLAMGG